MANTKINKIRLGIARDSEPDPGTRQNFARYILSHLQGTDSIRAVLPTIMAPLLHHKKSAREIITRAVQPVQEI